MSHARTDPERLRTEAYADSANLAELREATESAAVGAYVASRGGRPTRFGA